MKIKQVTHHNKPKWKVDRTVNGKRQRKYFDSKAEASKWVTLKENKERQLGVSVANIADEEFIREVVSLQKKLVPFDKSISEAVEHYIGYLEALGQSKTLGEMIEAFLKAKRKSKKSKTYLSELKCRLGKFKKHFGADSKPSTIDHQQAEAWLDGLEVGAQSWNHYHRACHTFYQWAVRKDWVSSNPFTPIDKISITREKPGIFTPAQMGTLIKQAEGNAELTAWIALGGYGGLRPAEILRLTWDCIHFDRKVIDLSESAAKGARQRLIEMRPALIAALEPIRQLGGSIVGQWFDSSKTLQDFKKDLEFEWPHDALRHSYGTYHLAAFENAAKTAKEMGHSSSAMLFKHYNRPGIDKATAYRYWGESPPKKKTAKRTKRARSSV